MYLVRLCCGSHIAEGSSVTFQGPAARCIPVAFQLHWVVPHHQLELDVSAIWVGGAICWTLAVGPLQLPVAVSPSPTRLLYAFVSRSTYFAPAMHMYMCLLLVGSARPWVVFCLLIQLLQVLLCTTAALAGDLLAAAMMASGHKHPSAGLSTQPGFRDAWQFACPVCGSCNKLQHLYCSALQQHGCQFSGCSVWAAGLHILSASCCISEQVLAFHLPQPAQSVCK